MEKVADIQLTQEQLEIVIQCIGVSQVAVKHARKLIALEDVFVAALEELGGTTEVEPEPGAADAEPATEA